MLPHRNEKKENKAPYFNTTESQRSRAGSQQKNSLPFLPLILDLIFCPGIMCLVWLRREITEEKGSVEKSMSLKVGSNNL